MPIDGITVEHHGVFYTASPSPPGRRHEEREHPTGETSCKQVYDRQGIKPDAPYQLLFLMTLQRCIQVLMGVHVGLADGLVADPTGLELD
jgi:hypothetical protein